MAAAAASTAAGPTARSGAAAEPSLPPTVTLLFGPHCVQGEAQHQLSAAEPVGDSPSVRRHASVHPRRPIPAPGADLVASSHPSLPPPPSQTLIVPRRGTFSVVDRRHGRISRSPTICGTQVSSAKHLASIPLAFTKSKNLDLTHPLLPTPPLASQAPPPTPAAEAVWIFGSPPSPRTWARALGPAEGARSTGGRAGSV